MSRRVSSFSVLVLGSLGMIGTRVGFVGGDAWGAGRLREEFVEFCAEWCWRDEVKGAEEAERVLVMVMGVLEDSPAVAGATSIFEKFG